MHRTLRRAKTSTRRAHSSSLRRARGSSLRRTKSASESEGDVAAQRTLKRTKSELDHRSVRAAQHSIEEARAWQSHGPYTLELCERIARLCDDAHAIRGMLELRCALNHDGRKWLSKLDAHLALARAKLNVDWQGAVDALVSAYTLLEFLALAPDAD